MNRYSIVHPSVTPEAYILDRRDKRKNYIKGLYIPSNPSELIRIIYAQPDYAIEEYVARKNKVERIPIHDFYHMYVDPHAYVDPYTINLVATRLYRQSFLTNIGLPSSEIVYGPALIYGSLPTSSYTSYLDNYSVPYELVEQVFRLYENYCYEM